MNKPVTLLILVLSVPMTFAQPMGGRLGTCELPEVLEAWSKPKASIASASERKPGDLAGDVGKPYVLILSLCTTSECKPGKYAASAAFDVQRPGRYRVAIDQRAWIDVHSPTAKLEGQMCEHAGCDPIKKIIQYDLAAGRHWVSIEGAAPIGVGLLLIRVNDPAPGLK